jgi:hypothetical protein
LKLLFLIEEIIKHQRRTHLSKNEIIIMHLLDCIA